MSTVTLASKYPLESKDTVLFGNKYVRFAQENGVVEMDVDAPKRGSERSKS